jgi:hypothetical protein
MFISRKTSVLALLLPPRSFFTHKRLAGISVVECWLFLSTLEQEHSLSPGSLGGFSRGLEKRYRLGDATGAVLSRCPAIYPSLR